MPDGGLGYYKPSFYNISLSYAKMFSDNIYGGLNVKMINEQIPNAAAKGVAIDAGIQYHTGKYNNIHVGIALKNWGPKMSYIGDGLSRQTSVNSFSGNYEMTVNNRSGAFELPTMVNIGASYDAYFHRDTTGGNKHQRLTFNGTFTSNSFTYDNGLFGLEAKKFISGTFLMVAPSPNNATPNILDCFKRASIALSVRNRNASSNISLFKSG